MKKAVYFAAIFLLFIGLLASCYDNRQGKTDEKAITDTLFQEIKEIPDEPAEAYPDVEILDAEDTLWCNGYLFVSQPIPDTVKARMQGKSMKDKARISYDQLRYLTVYHYDFEGQIKKGELVCNKAISHDLLCIFKALFSNTYPIFSIHLVDDFDADDEASMQANNTSCFNYRTIAGTKILSRHAFGMAVDINPLQNPCIRGTRIQPKTATDYVDRSKDFPHKIDKDDYCKEIFTSFGFRWGGDWHRMKDYQHFEKRK